MHIFGQRIKKMKKEGIIYDAYPRNCKKLEHVGFVDSHLLRFIFFHFKIHYRSQFALALRFQNSVLEILDKILDF